MEIDIASAAERLSDYWGTYPNQEWCESYTAQTFIDDALYAIGWSVSDRYHFGNGYDRFKKDLIAFLESGEWNPKEEER